ncbi:ARF GAP-like zinc finger-containing protein [Aphelenchoides avenae]|nr:ARF GAP-like zinc finger-containing protein [Aphelenchus avenae]
MRTNVLKFFDCRFGCIGIHDKLCHLWLRKLFLRKNTSAFANNQSDGASRGRGANTEPLGKRRTFGGGDDSSTSLANAGATFAGFDTSSGPSSNTSGGSFANAGFGNAGFGAPPSTKNASAPIVTSSSGFGNSAAGEFGSSDSGATNQANSSNSAPEATGGFATSGFGQPASQPAKPAEGFGNAGFGAPPQPTANSAAPSSAFGNAAGFGNAGFGAPATPNSPAVNSATEPHSEPPPKEINWDNTSSNDATDSGPEPPVAAASVNAQETAADPYADELIRTALASIPMLETEEQKAQKRKERAQAILRSKGKELVENVITGVKREKQSDLDRSEVHTASSSSLDASDKQDGEGPKMQFSFPLNMPASSSPPDAGTNVAFWPELSPEPEPTTDPEEANQVLTGDSTSQPPVDNSGTTTGETVPQPTEGIKPQEPDTPSTANKPEAPKVQGTKPANTGILAKMRKKMTAMQPWLHRQMSLEQQKSSKKSATPTAKRACARKEKQLSDDTDVQQYDKTIFALATDLSHDEKMNVGHFVGGKFMCPEAGPESTLVKGADEYYCVACDVYFKKDTRVLVKDGHYVEFNPGQIGIDGDEHECVDADLPCVLKHRRHAQHRSAPVKEKPKPTCRRTKKAPPKQPTPSPERSNDSDSSPEPPRKRPSETIDLEVKYPGTTEKKYIDFTIHSSPLYRQPITVWSARPSSDARLLRKQWPEFQKLYDEYNGVWNKYLQFACEVEGTHPAMDCDSLTTKELERRFLDLKKTNSRILAFIKLTKEQPKELRHMLQQKKGVDEAFRVFLPPEEVAQLGRRISTFYGIKSLVLVVNRSRGELVTTPESASDGEEFSSPEIGVDADLDLDAELIDPDEVDYNDHFDRRTVNLCLQFQCRIQGCGYRYYDSPSRRKDLVGHYLDKHVPKEQILPTYFEKQKPRQSDSVAQGTRKRQSEDDDVEMAAEPSPPAKKKKDEDVLKLRQDWPEYCRLEEKVSSRKRSYTLLKTKVEQLKFDDENLSAKFEEVDQRRHAVQKAEQRRDRFAELARQKPAELRELLSQGASINEVFLQMGTGRGDMVLEDLMDSEEDREAEKKKNKNNESSQLTEETKEEADDDLKWTEIDPEVFFERTELKGGTFRFTCKVDECEYKYSPGAKLLPETMLARLRQHFSEKHTGTRNGGPDQEKSYTCWEEWPQLSELYQRHKGLVHAVKNPKTGKGKRVALEAELRKSEHRYKCVRALIRFSTLPFHALLFDGLSLDEILKQLSYRLPASLQPEEEEEEASESHKQPATIEPVEDAPSTSKEHELDVDLSSFPETSIELQALYKLDVLEYKQFFELTDAGMYKCLFVDCDYELKATGSVKDPSYQLKRHCASFHF